MKKVLFSIIVSVFVFGVGINAQILIPIAEIQGEEFLSKLVGRSVKTRGIVTGLRKSGFYIQTPDDKVDDNPKTSEGVYVFTGKDKPSSKIIIGSLVEVSGNVTEYRSSREPYALFLTQITKPNVKVLSNDNLLPKPFVLTKEIMDPKGDPDQLEPFEGMRVRIDEVTVVAPTGGYENRQADKIVSDGVFYGVIGDTPRPFREAGLDALTVLFDKLPSTLPIFDMNPEMLRIDSTGLSGGEPIDVTTGAKIKELAGIIDYSFRAYTLMVDPGIKPQVGENMKPVITSPAGEREVTIASFNLENFFDDEDNSDLKGKETRISEELFKKRLKKASLAIRNVLSMPDVLGIIEVENLEVLKKLAKQINDDAALAKQTNPKYEAYLEESNDVRGIDVGFLIKTAKVDVIKAEQLAKDKKFDYRVAKSKETLFSRPPLLMQFEVPDAKTGEKFAFTVIVNHFKSYLGISDRKSGSRVQNKRRLQAEFLAQFIQNRQRENPTEKIAVLGDFNAFQFNDGYNDLIGILEGKPERNILTPSQEVFQTGLIDLVDYISQDSRYSFIYGGNAQVLDHILINKPLQDYATKFGYARLNADFPKIYANDENSPVRISDHDAPVAYLSLDGKNPDNEEPAPTNSVQSQ